MKRTIVLVATGNPGKYREIRRIISPFLPSKCKITSLKTFKKLPEVKESGKTYLENALKKARKISALTGLITVADDSGLEVFSLNKRPGVRSARFAGEASNDGRNNEKLLKLLKKKPDSKRKARFVCSAVAFFPKRRKWIASTARVSGIIGKKKTGNKGFGYDPLFFYPPLKKTFAQISAQKKNRISHRARAFAMLGRKMKGLIG